MLLLFSFQYCVNGITILSKEFMVRSIILLSMIIKAVAFES